MRTAAVTITTGLIINNIQTVHYRQDKYTFNHSFIPLFDQYSKYNLTPNILSTYLVLFHFRAQG